MELRSNYSIPNVYKGNQGPREFKSALNYSLVHLFIQQVFVECIACIGHHGEILPNLGYRLILFLYVVPINILDL